MLLFTWFSTGQITMILQVINVTIFVCHLSILIRLFTQILHHAFLVNSRQIALSLVYLY